jgi:pimeloyl-ACP methyl ester carboxylesterase
MTADAAGVEAQVADLRYLLAQVEERYDVDHVQIGTAGFSWGGISNVLLALREPRITAVIALDGSIGYPVGLDAVAEIEDFDGASMRAAFLHLASARRGAGPGLDVSFYQSARAVDRYLGQFLRLEHGDFSSDTIARFTHCRALPGREHADEIDDGHAAICRYALNFFDAYVRQDELAREFLTVDPEDVEVPSGVMDLQRRTAAPK